MAKTRLQRCAVVLAGRIIVPLVLALVFCLPTFCDLVTAPKDYLALKKQLHAIRYEGAGFMTDKVYEMAGRLSGVIATSSSKGADIQTVGQTLHVRLAEMPKGISVGATIRILVRMHPEECVLEAVAMVTERDGNLIDPDPKVRAEAKKIAVPPFKTFKNPFLTGADRLWPPEELIIYTFDALQSWVLENEAAQGSPQTPREFCRQLGAEMPEAANALEHLAFLYGHVAYGTSVPGNYDPEQLRLLWHCMAGPKPVLLESR